jgi:hypothetical protein
MRPPLVKRQTPPESGFCIFFRRVGPGVVRLSHRVRTWLLCPGTDTLCLHHTLMAARSPSCWRVQRHGDAMLCGLATSPCPPPVRGTVAAQRRACASESQVRGRGSTHGAGAPRAAAQEPERRSQPRPRARGARASGLLRVPCRRERISARHARRRPCSSRAACGSAAPLPDPWRHFCLSNTVARVSLS